MSRSTRFAPGGMPFHVLNRGVGRPTLFDKPDDLAALLRVIDEPLPVAAMRICGLCLMGNHWHFVV